MRLTQNTLIFAVGCTLLATQMLALSLNLDAYALIQSGAQGWVQIFGHMGDVARWLLVFVACFVVLSHKTLVADINALTGSLSVRRAVTVGLVQCAVYGGFYYLSVLIFSAENIQVRTGIWYWAWLIVGLTCSLLWLLMWGTAPQILAATKARAAHLLLSASTATLISALALFSQSLWGPMANFTFYLSSKLLTLVSIQKVVSLEDERILGAGEFLVNIAPACAGYEGIGLVTAFTALFLFSQKSHMRFPQSFVLFPIGVLAVWLLNVVRIVVLILLGAHYSPEVAIGGFHSLGGWITFILVSLAILFFASKSRWLTTLATEEKAPLNQAAATLYPFIALLACTMLTMALSAGFDYLYPLRVLIVAIVIVFCWKALSLPKPSFSLTSIIAGVSVAVLWFFLVPINTEYDAKFLNQLQTMPTWVAASWLALRFLGSTITVPIAEELAFRGYLLCIASKVPVALTNTLSLNIVGLVVSSVAFGALHGDYFAGIIAGLVYGWVRIQGRSIYEAIFAHALTNALLFASAAATGRWVLI